MPRRISDYPDAYFYWNSVASQGSMISVIASLLFFLMLFVSLTKPLRNKYNYKYCGNLAPNFVWKSDRFISFILPGFYSAKRKNCKIGLKLGSYWYSSQLRWKRRRYLAHYAAYRLECGNYPKTMRFPIFTPFWYEVRIKPTFSLYRLVRYFVYFYTARRFRLVRGLFA